MRGLKSSRGSSEVLPNVEVLRAVTQFEFWLRVLFRQSAIGLKCVDRKNSAKMRGWTHCGGNGDGVGQRRHGTCRGLALFFVPA
jgi:hypothetical protein